MVIGERLRELREQKNLSQGHIEQKTGLLRCYVSRVENGHTVPSLETLEKFANALEAPLYKLFFDGDAPSGLHVTGSKNVDDKLWGSKGAEAKTLRKFRKLLEKISDQDRGVLLHMAQKMQKR
jgi:transcriptional regulator with XRE-family HTH domain